MQSIHTPTHRQFTTYWDQFYARAPHMKPSSFATSSAERWLSSATSILEIGCGNGRDSLWFSSLGHEVTGVDLSSKAVESCREAKSPATFLNADFSELNLERSFGAVYSRFTLHSIDDEAETRTLDSVARHLQPGGLFLLEARTLHDELCGQGERISDREWIHGNHYRRFLDPVEFLLKARQAGFQPEYMLMSAGLAVWNELDPVVIRLALRRI